jgi:thymidylate synthase
LEIERDGLDEVLIELYKALLVSPLKNKGSRGDNIDLLGVALRIRRPRARLSRSENRGRPFSAIGELLWYLSRSDELEFIEPYLPKYEKDARDGVLHGAYGPRLFAMHGKFNQLENVSALLRKRDWSRRAVIQLFDAEDISDDFPEVPCTTTLQFHVRNGALNLGATMRSNDAYWGLPHDVFCFTMLQEMMSKRLGLELGEYYHYAGSMHVYEDKRDGIEEYVEEGFQKVVEMPPMPDGDPFEIVPTLLDAEKSIRGGELFVASDLFGQTYWADIVRLIEVFWARGNGDRLDELAGQFANPMYREYLAGLRHRMERREASREERS